MKKHYKKIAVLAMFSVIIGNGYSQSNCDNKVSTDPLATLYSLNKIKKP